MKKVKIEIDDISIFGDYENRDPDEKIYLEIRITKRVAKQIMNNDFDVEMFLVKEKE